MHVVVLKLHTGVCSFQIVDNADILIMETSQDKNGLILNIIKTTGGEDRERGCKEEGRRKKNS